MQKFRAIIIDDERSAIENLQILIAGFCPNVEVVGAADNASDAIHLIHANKPDIVFLDMNIPIMKGFDIIEMASNKDFKIIVISGHQEYALEGIKHQVLDYILKPIDIKELTTAISKMPIKEKNHYQVTVADLQNVYVVRADDVIYIKQDKVQTDIIRKNGEMLKSISKTIGFYEEAFKESNQFYRCHQSFFLNLQEVIAYNKANNQAEMSNGHKIAVSRDKKDGLLDLLKGKN